MQFKHEINLAAFNHLLLSEVKSTAAELKIKLQPCSFAILELAKSNFGRKALVCLCRLKLSLQSEEYNTNFLGEKYSFGKKPGEMICV